MNVLVGTTLFNLPLGRGYKCYRRGFGPRNSASPILTEEGGRESSPIFYQMEGSAASSNSNNSPSGRMCLTVAPRSRKGVESKPTRWQLARGRAWLVRGWDSEHMMATRASEAS